MSLAVNTYNLTRTEDVRNVKGIMFEHMGLKKELLLGIKDKGFEKPSPIQEESIPNILAGSDVLARAKNGTGKTASFLIPIINLVTTSNNHLQAIIIVPTRELAVQTCRVCSELSKYMNIVSYAIYGGSSVSNDTAALQLGVHILISTPGRIIDYANQNILSLLNVKYLAIDEADTVIASRENEVTINILSRLRKDRQILLFSATFPRVIAQFRDKYMKNVVEINLMHELTLKGVTQYYAYTEEKDKLSCLFSLVSKLKINQAIIFCNSVNRVELLTKKLSELNLSCKCIHSKMDQKERLRVFEQFRKGEFTILICTDLFNRGIDIQSVNVVINFDLPKTSSTYLHRIGRSGRFGNIGLGISFVSSYDKDQFFKIEKELSLEIPPVPKDIAISHGLYVYNVAFS